MSVEYTATDTKEIEVDKSKHFTTIRIIHSNYLEDSISLNNEDAEKLIKLLQEVK